MARRKTGGDWWILALFGLLINLGAGDIFGANPSNPERLERLVEANILGVHAFQIGLQKSSNQGDLNGFDAGSLDVQQLKELSTHQKQLLSTNLEELKKWTRSEASSFDPAADLEPLLSAGLKIPESAPVNVYAHYLEQKTKKPRAEIRAVANLYQTVLEVERDGDLLQDEFRFYIALGLPVYPGQFGLPGSDPELLEVGKLLAPATCSAPFDTDAAAWQIAGRKIWNWGEKNLHIRDEKVLARELLREPEVRALVPKMKKMPAQKIAVIGHSFTMGLHWSAPSSFVPIVTAMFALENPKVEFRQFQGGGLTASRAYKNFYQEALAWKPDLLLLVVMTRQEEDFVALQQMGSGFQQAGIKAVAFDNLQDPLGQDPAMVDRYQRTARQAGFTLILVDAVLSASPDHGKFLCLDQIHMTEPYHRLMAKEWLKFLTK